MSPTRLKIFTFLLIVLSSIRIHAQDKPKVIASCSMISDMTENIVGDLMDVEMIVPIGGDPHIYEPTPSDARMVSTADIVFINGLTFEGWITDLISNAAPNVPVVTVTEGINAIQSEKYDNSADPHAWMDFKNGLQYVLNIKDALVALYPKYESQLEMNYNKYISEIKAADLYVQEQINLIPKDKRVLITSHDAFEYYGKRYGIQLEALMGISTNSDARTSDIIRVSRIIKEKNIPSIFVESTINPKLIQQIAEDSNITIGGELYADSLGEEDSEAGTYITMLKHNTDIIVQALAFGKTSETKIDRDDTTSNIILYGILGLLLIGGLLFMILRLNAKK